MDAFVGGVGTGGTISGVSHTLKKANPAIEIYAVEADESAVLSGENLDHIKSKDFLPALSLKPSILMAMTILYELLLNRL